jgi:hypothetical protein
LRLTTFALSATAVVLALLSMSPVLSTPSDSSSLSVSSLNLPPDVADYFSRIRNRMIRLQPFIRSMPRRTLGPIATEDLAMFTRHTHDRFTSLVVTGLAIVVTTVVASLGYAVANIQIVA